MGEPESKDSRASVKSKGDVFIPEISDANLQKQLD